MKFEMYLLPELGDGEKTVLFSGVTDGGHVMRQVEAKLSGNKELVKLLLSQFIEKGEENEAE